MSLKDCKIPIEQLESTIRRLYTEECLPVYKIQEITGLTVDKVVMKSDLLLDSETKAKYGYVAELLSYGSPRPIIHRCPECQQAKETPYKLFVQGKNLRHRQCYKKKARITNLKRYGVINAANAPEKLAKRQQKKDQEIIDRFAKESYQVARIERDRDRGEIIVYFICPEKHQHRISWKAWRTFNQRCGKCFGNNDRITFASVQQSFVDQRYNLLTDHYEDQNTELRYICPKGHQNSTSWKIWAHGCRCPVCNPASTSSGERELKEHFKGFAPIKTRKVIAPYELDCYFEEQKLAIEYCGLYWHSDSQERIKSNYHYNKMQRCNQQGVQLITVFEDEWLEKKDICISRIASALGITKQRYYARNCTCKEISSTESALFFNSNHLQGYAKGSQKSFGLYYNDQVVYAVALGAPSRAHTSKGKRVLELKRMAPKINTSVVGAASKLFKVIKQYAKGNNYQQIKSYCDMRWGTGGVYKIFGMTLEGKTCYTPHYTNGIIRYRNQTFAGKDLPKGWYKIYDCGHQTWVYNF